MAFSLGQFFGIERKRADIPKFEGTKPFKSLREIPETQTFLKNLNERIAGRGVGFREEELSTLTSPFAKARRAAFTEEQVPEISSQASSRGVGRSTIPVNRIALERRAVENDIGQRIAALRLANEQQRRTEINQAVSDIGQFGLNEASVRGSRAGFELKEFEPQRQAIINESSKVEDQRLSNQNKFLSLGAAGLGGAFGGVAGAGLLSGIVSGNTGATSSSSTADLTNLLRQLEAAAVRKS